MNKIIYDKELWFMMKKGDCDSECNGKHFIIGNPHTFSGRIEAYCPEKNRFFNVSLMGMDKMSQATKYWVKGYLSGNEPSPPVDEEDFVLPITHEDYLHWKESIELFHKTGYWYYGDRQCDICDKRLLNSWDEFECKNCLNENGENNE